MLKGRISAVNRKLAALLPWVLFGLAGCASTSGPSPDAPTPANTQLKVHVLDVGQGFCILIECPAPDKPILYDCGSSGGAVIAARANQPLVKQRLAELLQAGGYIVNGKAQLQALVVSHSDKDHYNWLPFVAPLPAALSWTDMFTVMPDDAEPLYPEAPTPPTGPFFNFDKVLYSGLLSDYNLNKYVQTVAATPGVTTVLATPGSPYRTGRTVGMAAPLINNQWPVESKLTCGQASGQGLTILSVNVPDPSQPTDPNPKSVVLRIENGTSAFVVAGDAELSTFNGIINDYALTSAPNPAKRPPYKGMDSTALNTSLLIAPHHGASTKGSADGLWAYLVNPKMVIFSAGSYGGYFHPRCATLNTYARQVTSTGVIPNNKVWRDAMTAQGENDCQTEPGCEAYYETTRAGYLAQILPISPSQQLCCGPYPTGWQQQTVNNAAYSTWVNGSISTMLVSTGGIQAVCTDSSGSGPNTGSCNLPRNRFARALACQR